MRHNTKKAIALLLAIASTGSLTGCSTTLFEEDPTKYPLVPALTESEVIDYYAEALSFDAIVSKNLDVDKTNFEMKDVENEELKNRLISIYNETEGLLGKMEYEGESDALTEENFHYIKSYLNDKKADNGQIISVRQSMGYYFIDVEYTLSARTPGSFKNEASLVGLNGALVHSDYYNTDSVDTAFMQQAVTKLNKYYEENKIADKKASFNISTLTFSTDPSKISGIDFTDTTIQDQQTPSESEQSQESSAETPVVQDETQVDQGNVEAQQAQQAQQATPEVADETSDDETSDDETSDDETSDDEDSTDNNYIDESVAQSSGSLTLRSPSIDIAEFNRVVGGSTKHSAYMPYLDFVYNIPAEEGDISGIGIWPSGIGGLTKFGFSRSQMAGTLTLRFVYKDDLDNIGNIVNTNIYPVFSEITTGFSSTNDNIVPEFLMTEFEKLIERADRAITNNDLPALMGGTIFADMGAAILRGYESQFVNMTRQISTVRRVVSRNLEDNSYIIEVESQRQEGPKGAEVYGTYRDKSYVVVEQIGQNFVITDWLTLTRQMQTEPDINPDSAVAKRLVALNLAGEVPDDAKGEITTLLNSLYNASTLRILNGPQEITDSSGAIVQVELGMYDCFNDDPEMLSSSKKEQINSKLRSMLVKYGTNTPAQMNGTITEWIGGANNQAEFMTEELITYTGRDEAIYMTCYYLVSKMNDVWVIDDLQVVTAEEYSGQELDTIKSRLGI